MRLLARSRLYYGWWVVLVATLAMSLASGTSFWAFGVFIDPLEAEFGWTRAQVSGAISGSLVVGGLGGPLVGAWVDRYGARSAVLAGALLTGASYLLLGAIGQLWQLYVLYMVASFFRAWMYYIPLNALVTRWFDRRRGMALGIVNAGFGLGGAALTPLIAFVVDEWGWRQGYVVSGLPLIAIVAPLAFLVIRSRPEEMGLAVEGQATVGASRPGLAAPGSRHQWSVAEALHTWSFWLLALAFSLFFTGHISLLVHTVPFFISRGIGEQQAAQLMGYTALLLMVSRLASSLFVDRITSTRMVAVMMALIHVVVVVLVAAVTGPSTVALFVVLRGVALGGGLVVEPLIISTAFGVANYGAILGVLGLVETVGLVVGPIVGGVVFDARGSYDLAFLLYAVFFALAGLCFFVFRPPRPLPAR